VSIIPAAAPDIATQRKGSSSAGIPFHLAGVVAVISDLVVIMGACLASGALYHQFFLGTDTPIEPLFTLGAFVFVNFAITQAARGKYRPQQLFASRKQIESVSAIWLLTFTFVLAAAFSFKLTAAYSRGASFAFFASGWTGLVIARVLLARFLHRTLSRAAFAQQQVLVITDGSQTNASASVNHLRQCGYTPLKIIDIDLGERQGGPAAGLSIAVLNDIIETSRKTDLNSIFLEISWSRRQAIDQIMSQLRVLSLPVYLLPDNNVAHFLKQQALPIGMGWSAELKRAPLSPVEQTGKRCLDVFVSLTMLVLLAPLLALVCLAIRLDSRGPIFFLQTRHGFNGRPFRIFKFRTMKVSACDQPVQQATRRDPRITFLGRILRRTNIDELPQLFNVILGDMSLVGPRPHAAEHNTEYEKLISNYAFRYHMLPGITGWAQIQGLRGETKTLDGMVERVEADLWYVNNWSFLLDLKILLRTLVLGIQPTAY
jgi:Undecaprenyl-phosphate glucose phosphotransferase